jgi:hypothetical protein
MPIPRRRGSWPCTVGLVCRRWAAAARRRLRPALTGWHAGQGCSGCSAGPEVPDAWGAEAVLFSQQTGHSMCACACRPCSCSHTKYAAPATSNKPGPPPKGRPGTLGIRRSIAGHLPIGKAARWGVALAAGPFQCGTTMPICGGIIDAETSRGRPRNAEPDQTRSRQPVTLNHRSRTVSGSESAVALPSNICADAWITAVPYPSADVPVLASSHQ